MREFDTNGLRLCEYQGKIFERSVDEINCSSKMFIRRFVNSNILYKLDKNDSVLFDLDPNTGIKEIKEEFNNLNQGNIKESKDAMFWLGYLLRYISYTRGERTKFILKIFDYEKILSEYYSYHTQSMEWCVRSLLESNGLDELIFDKNYRLLKALKAYSN